MKVMLIVKGEYAVDALDQARKHLPHVGFSDPVVQLRLGAYRLTCELDDTRSVYEWFNEGGFDAPYPDGTLLFFTVSP